MIRERKNNRSYKSLIKIVRILVIIQFSLFLSVFISSLKSMISGSEGAETLTIVSGLLSLMHILFGYNLFVTYRRILYEDKKISKITILEGFVFANIPGLIITMMAKARQEEEALNNKNTEDNKGIENL